jgi:hypothetical protein
MPTPKIRRVLTALASGQSLNRFQAAMQIRDWCLNSTVSEIESRFGVKVSRRFETVPGFQGAPTRCCRYWLEPAQRETAQRVLEAR